MVRLRRRSTTTGSFIAQAIMTIRTPRTRAASRAGMYAMFTVGVALWLTYGIARVVADDRRQHR